MNTDKPIQFFNKIEEIHSIMPITPLKDYKHPWKDRARKDFQVPKCPVTSILNISRCPGINNIQEHGWIIKTWQDITIKTYSDGAYEWSTPSDQFDIAQEEALTEHKEELYSKYRKHWPINTFKHLLKFNTLWKAIIPEGHTLLQLPIPYYDNNLFTTAEGAYSSTQGPASLNIPVYWHRIEGEEFLPAGTPIAYLVLVADKLCPYNIGNPVETDRRRIKTYYRALNNKFVRDYKKIKELWKNNT
jgi:hypothetical protein